MFISIKKNTNDTLSSPVKLHVRQGINTRHKWPYFISGLLRKLSVIKLNMRCRKVNQVHVIPKRMRCYSWEFRIPSWRHDCLDVQRPLGWQLGFLEIKTQSHLMPYVVDTHTYTETEMSSFWWNFNHWLHWKLSKWQLPVQPVMKI